MDETSRNLRSADAFSDVNASVQSSTVRLTQRWEPAQKGSSRDDALQRANPHQITFGRAREEPDTVKANLLVTTSLARS